jgi:excisionase family DNA binding protein
MHATKTLLTVAEAATRLKCHPHTVRRWIWAGRLHAVKVGDLVRIPEAEINRLIQPADESPAGKKSIERNPGVSALRSTMRLLRKDLDPTDVELLESKIAEGKQTSAPNTTGKVSYYSTGPR